MSAPYARTVMTGNGAGATAGGRGADPATATNGAGATAGGRGADPATATNGAGATAGGRGADSATGGPPPVLLATLGAASISASAVLIKLAHTGVATAAFYRCLLALPVLAMLAVLEQRRRGPRLPR